MKKRNLLVGGLLVGMTCFGANIQTVKPGDVRFGNANNLDTKVIQYELDGQSCAMISMKDEFNLEYLAEKKLAVFTKPNDSTRYEVWYNEKKIRIFYGNVKDCEQRK